MIEDVEVVEFCFCNQPAWVN